MFVAQLGRRDYKANGVTASFILLLQGLPRANLLRGFLQLNFRNMLARNDHKTDKSTRHIHLDALGVDCATGG